MWMTSWAGYVTSMGATLADAAGRVDMCLVDATSVTPTLPGTCTV